MPETLQSIQERYPGAETFRFGDSEELSHALIALVRAGKKRATCSSILNTQLGNAIPELGRRDIALNWDGTPALVIETKELREVRFRDMTEEMALMEGEDETLAEWQAGHRAFYERHGVFDLDMVLTWERFEVIEDFADV
jgi:uncharacterized protein YhfF